ncbi:cell division protein ZipA [Simiduia curdlanivorans]|uniref:Cell division protein ZipA n=1 Tax=Simiduia curdlanivorans TaxID=1492769 RepID=A0ABV8V8M0_9GAMM|nr:cell division protein ZipA [Simiduia curdlanivorans]MDN3639405.1 cell division protein ZipA [Simiduia curdlanivorans]
MREWLTVIIACLIIGVLLDGLRRMRAAKRGDMKMSLSMHKGTNKDDLAAYGSELPNGGARVVAKREALAAQAKAPKAEPAKPVVKAAAAKTSAPKASTPKPVPAKPAKPAVPPVTQAELDLDQHVPLLMNVDDDPVAEPLDMFEDDDNRREPSFSASADVDDEIDAADAVEAEDEAVDDEQDDYDRVLFSGRSESPQASSAASFTDADEADDDAEPEEVFVINVMAPKGEVFIGEAIKDAILTAGMRFGSRKIFHMHEDLDGEGAIQFSLVNMVQPGVFDLHKMDQIETRGLSLFMTLPSEAESLPAYEAMVKAARFLAEDLGGELRDEQHSTLTAQTIEHNRARVSEYERKLQLAKARQ